VLAGLLLGGGLCAAQPAPDAAAPLDAAVARAETSLREGEPQSAESHYRDALVEGWLLMGALEAAEHDLPAAREAFVRASNSAVQTRRALQSLALVHLQMGAPSQAVGLLTRVAGQDPRDLASRRLLAQALVAAGQPEQAVQELEEAHDAAPDDPETAFVLATGYLKLGKIEPAARLFDEVARARPMARTRVLVGRTYRDFGQFERARAELRAALRQDPRVPRAHYYLGRIAVTAGGLDNLAEAAREFQEELKLAPQDPLASLHLGMALVEARRAPEALPALELAARSQPPRAEAFYYLGRCRLALEQPAEALVALRRALELAEQHGASPAQRGGLHYQLGLALRALGRSEEAATHFAAAERLAAEGADSSRERLARYLADSPDPEIGAVAAAPLIEASPLAGLTSAQRQQLRPRVVAALARAYSNLGVMQAQAGRFARAAEHFEHAAEVDPDFPRVQYSVGVARFNAGQFARATGPLSRALEADPRDADLKRMLALACFNAEDYAQAARLLRDDPRRDADPGLQYAYGVALVRSGRAAEAQVTFSRLLAAHADAPELSVVLGQAHAQQGDYEAAVQALTRALKLRADVPEANATLGVIYLKQGRLADAEAALRAELRARPDDFRSQHNLATVLDLEGRPDEALRLLRAILKARPEFADARYLLGKVLLAQGEAAQAVEQLEAAARLAPEDANIHYQLAQAYRQVGQPELSEKEFEIFRRLKDQRRGGAS
jgi:tetratricopeptide (TPR) repeat protein